jgi:hypothetical protein
MTDSIFEKLEKELKELQEQSKKLLEQHQKNLDEIEGSHKANRGDLEKERDGINASLDNPEKAEQLKDVNKRLVGEENRYWNQLIKEDSGFYQEAEALLRKQGVVEAKLEPEKKEFWEKGLEIVEHAIKLFEEAFGHNPEHAPKGPTDHSPSPDHLHLPDHTTTLDLPEVPEGSAQWVMAAWTGAKMAVDILKNPHVAIGQIIGSVSREQLSEDQKSDRDLGSLENQWERKAAKTPPEPRMEMMEQVHELWARALEARETKAVQRKYAQELQEVKQDYQEEPQKLKFLTQSIEQNRVDALKELGDKHDRARLGRAEAREGREDAREYLAGGFDEARRRMDRQYADDPKRLGVLHVTLAEQRTREFEDLAQKQQQELQLKELDKKKSLSQDR